MFKFILTNPAEVVAPGLSISGVLTFTPEKREELSDCLLIHIDAAETINIPLLV